MGTEHPGVDGPATLDQALQRIAGAQLLLVEDNQVNALIAKGILAKRGFAVTTACNGQAAVALVCGREDAPRFRLVIMDIEMPVMNGLEATRQIRADPRHARLPIVAMTAHTGADERERCLEAGISDVMTKPIDRDALLAAVCRWVEPPESASRQDLPAVPETPDDDDSIAASLPGVDVAASLARVSGDTQLYRKLLRRFRRDHADTAARLRGEIARGELVDVLRRVHTIKGVAGNLGMLGLRDACSDIETAARGSPAQLGPAVDRFAARLRDILAAIDRLAARPRRNSSAVGGEERKGGPAPDLGVIRARLCALAWALESDASFVDALLAEVEAGLDGAGVGELLAELGESADEFGFSEARRCLARVAEKLGLSVSPVAPDSAGGPRPRVLVVDDSPENIHLLLRCLGDEYAVSVALDGETALECVRGPATPAVVLLDVVMPGTDGYEVCRKLRADPATRDIPVLFLTALNEERDEARGLALGAMDFITKPFSPHRVKARVRNHVRLRSAMLEVERQSCELRRANEELLRSNLELKQLGQQKSEFLGIAVHDLKNPLVAIAGLAKLLLQAANPGDSGALRPERRNEMLAAIHASAEHMGGIIKDLLQSEAIDSGRISLECREQALAPLLERAVELNRTQADRKRLDLNVSLAHGCVASLDGRRMLEVVDNLLSNAIKFSPPGKRIWVELSRLPGPPPMARISVRDEGPGLSADDMGRLFGRFVKLSARPTGGESSSGLGLSIVKRLAELHQGRVWAESEPGQGAVFLVELPVVAD